MKRLLSLTMIAALAAFAIVACKDDFNEEEFLRLQSELKLKQDEVMRQRNDSTSKEAVQSYINAANEAGDLLSVSLILRENGNPLPGVTVTLSSGTTNEISSGRTNAVTTGTTDATGNVVFDRVTIGSGTATFSKTGYVSASATYDFSSLALAPVPVQVPNPNGSGTYTYYIAPQKRFEEAVVQMISATASEGSTATITGKVTIENDVTNLTPEVPTGIVLRANLTNLLPNNQGFFTSYVLSDNSTLGRATIAADGTYTMIVPATAAGTTINMIVPNIEGNCRMAVNGVDNGAGVIVPLANGPEYRNVPTSWGPQAPTGFGNTVPGVAGAKLVYSQPPAAGTGLTFDFTPVPRPLVTSTGTPISSAETMQVGETFFKIASRGNYGSGPAPAVSISGGGGQGAVADVFMRTYVAALTVTNVGAGYTPNSNITLRVQRVRHDDLVFNQGDAITVQATSTGTLPPTIDLAAFANSIGWHPNNQVTMTSTNLKSLRISVTGDGPDNTEGVVSAVFKTELERISFDPLLNAGSGLANPGSGFTSAPTITFTGGGLADGSADHASVQVVDFPVNWTISPNNTSATDYPLVPVCTVTYPVGPNGDIPAETVVQVWSASGDLEIGFTSLTSRLTVSNGDIVKREPARVLRTNTKSGGKPTILVTTETPQNAARPLLPANILQGSITSFPGAGNLGNGYNAPLTVSVQPAIAGAPGSGAAITLTNFFDPLTLEYTWLGATTIQSQGSGYLSNLNQKAAENASGLTVTIQAQAGKTYTADIVYGTGNRKMNVN